MVIYHHYLEKVNILHYRQQTTPRPHCAHPDRLECAAVPGEGAAPGEAAVVAALVVVAGEEVPLEATVPREAAAP